MDQKLENLNKVVKLTEELGLPLLGGTEMNSPGQKFVDNFSSAELSPHHNVFLRGSWILHTFKALQRYAGMGYLSEWAKNQFTDVKSKNEFYSSFGERFSARADQALQNSLDSEMGSDKVLKLAERLMSV